MYHVLKNACTPTSGNVVISIVFHVPTMATLPPTITAAAEESHEVATPKKCNLPLELILSIRQTLHLSVQNKNGKIHRFALVHHLCICKNTVYLYIDPVPLLFGNVTNNIVFRFSPAASGRWLLWRPRHVQGSHITGATLSTYRCIIH